MTAVIEQDSTQAVCQQIASAHDRFAEREQVLRYEGRHVEAEGAHVFALRLLRAYEAEAFDPEPPGPCSCSLCERAYAKGRA
jgi:hypothetical protein